jgi:eukaryotic-like serine/threonine-protein kinase
MLLSTPQREFVEKLAEEFVASYRRGEKPTPEEYAVQYSGHAEEILDLFPTLAMMEQLAPDDARSSTSSAEPTLGSATGKPPERLGDFRILREVGRGGMGIVYEAEQLSLSRHVALKILPDQMFSSPKRRQRFEREARAAARLHHTNIVPVFGVGEESGFPYYVMQLIPGLGLDLVLDELRRVRHAGSVGVEVGPDTQGGLTIATVVLSLFQKSTDRSGETDGGVRSSSASTSQVAVPSSVARGRGVDSRRADWSTYWQSVARIGLNAAEAVAYAHHEGVLHRDIKPGNLMLDERGNVWITDFGLAKSDDQNDLTNTGEIIGTLRYLAPEALDGKGDVRSEVYALGLTLYEMLALRPAFDESDRRRLMQLIMTKEPVRLERIEPGLPRDLVTIVHKAIDREPSCRYQTARELAADLRAFLDDAPIQARRPWWPERLFRWVRHHRGLAGAIASAAVVLVGITIASILIAARFRTLAAERETARIDAVDAQNEARRRGNAERWERYRAILGAAASDLGLQDVDAARRTLATAPIEFRNWEWWHLSSQLDWSQAVLRGHEATIVALTASPDGREIVTGSEDGWVRVWHLPSGKPVPTTKQHLGGIRALTFSSDGRRFASVGYDPEIRLWDPATGTVDLTLRGHTKPNRYAAFSPDGRRIVTASEDQTLRLWETTTGKNLAILRGHMAVVQRAAFSPDGRRIASGGEDGTVRLWDVETASPIATLTGHGHGVLALAYSPDGKVIATGGGFPDNTVRFWDAQTGRALAVGPGHHNEVTSLTFSPDSSRLASTSADQTIRLWKPEGELIAVLRGHTRSVRQVSFSANGRRLISASEDQSLRMWDASDGQSISVLRGHTGGVCGAVFLPGGSLIASASADRTVRLWNADVVASNGVLGAHSSYVYDLAFTPDGKRLASAGWDHTIRLWDLSTEREYSKLHHDATTGGREGPTSFDCAYLVSVAISPNGQFLASVCRDDRIYLWDLASARPIRVLDVPTSYWAIQSRVSFDPSSRILATGGQDGLVRLWDVETGKLVASLSGHSGCAGDVVFSPDGATLASAGQDGTVRLWDVATHASLGVFRGHTDRVYRLAFRADGSSLASASEDRTVRLWDLRSHEASRILAHGSVVYGLTFSPDSSRLATACADNTIRLWDLSAGAEVVELRGHTAYVHAVAFSPDGTRLASASGDFTVRIWDTLPPHERASAGK